MTIMTCLNLDQTMYINGKYTECLLLYIYIILFNNKHFVLLHYRQHVQLMILNNCKFNSFPKAKKGPLDPF